MEALRQEILKLLVAGPQTSGEIKNRLNTLPGWDVSVEDVDEVLRRLEAMLVTGPKSARFLAPKR